MARPSAFSFGVKFLFVITTNPNSTFDSVLLKINGLLCRLVSAITVVVTPIERVPINLVNKSRVVLLCNTHPNVCHISVVNVRVLVTEALSAESNSFLIFQRYAPKVISDIVKVAHPIKLDCHSTVDETRFVHHVKV